MIEEISRKYRFALQSGCQNGARVVALLHAKRHRTGISADGGNAAVIVAAQILNYLSQNIEKEGSATSWLGRRGWEL